MRAVSNCYVAVIFQADNTESKRNERLLDFLEKCDDKKFDAFCLAMKETEQQHLVDKYWKPPRDWRPRLKTFASIDKTITRGSAVI